MAVRTRSVTSKANKRGQQVVTFVLALAWLLLVCCPRLLALDPTLGVGQHAHTNWKISDGFVKGTILAMAQTPDGYLWLGTEFGLLRFDGVRALAWQPPDGQHLPSEHVRNLLAARDGTLWIGTVKGLGSLKDGKLTLYPQLAGRNVAALLEDRDGTVWAGGAAIPHGRLCAIRNEEVECSGDDGSLGLSVEALFEDRAGNLWAGASTGLWRWKPGPPKLYPLPAPGVTHSRDLVEGDDGALLIGVQSGILQLKDETLTPLPLPDTVRQFKLRGMLRDHDGGLWIGTAGTGLLHLHDGKADRFARSDGLSGDLIQMLFEDREQNIWIATSNGLDRFRDYAVPEISDVPGLSDAIIVSVLADKDGSVWFGTRDGLRRWDRGLITIYRSRRAGPNTKPTTNGHTALYTAGESGAVREVTDPGLPDSVVDSLFQDETGRIWISTAGGLAYFANGKFGSVSSETSTFAHSMAGDGSGNLWISQGGGLLHLRDGNVVESLPWSSLGRKDNATALAPDPLQGGLWLGFLQGGIANIKDGQVQATYGVDDGLGSGRVSDLKVDDEGSLWVATETGLSRVKNGRATTLSSKNGLPCDAVHWVMEDNSHSLWLYMACGLVRISRPDLDNSATMANEGPNPPIRVMLFDNADGVRSRMTPSGYSPRVTKSTDGRLWFLSGEGVSVVDPLHLHLNIVPPPVHIEQITADGKTYDVSEGLTLPPLVRDLAIDYTALSLVAPEKVRFRYMLEGQDPDWKEVVNDREVQYSNLAPGHYRFRVIACNNSGVWNEEGASLGFKVLPAFYQTNWFLLLCFAVLGGLLWTAYRYRVHQSNARMQLRFDERLAERTHIAQELHDSLLQGVVSASIRLNVAVDNLPEDLPEREQFDRVIELMQQVTDEGRNTLRGLRSAGEQGTEPIEIALANLHLVPVGKKEVNFRVLVEGKSRDLSPIAREEAFHIGSEALYNAYRHSNADNIETVVEYSSKYLRVLVRDDGKGIDAKFLKSGRVGHWGLTGMRERAEKIGAELKIRSRPEAGTEVELMVPGHIAFDKSALKRSFRWPFKPFAQKLAEPQEQEDK